MEALIDLDLRILYFIQENLRTPLGDLVMRFITSLGDGGWFWIALTLALCIVKKTRRAGFTAAIALIVGALLTNILLKNAVARIRPYDLWTALQPIVERPKDYSFPSGHTTASMAATLTYCKTLPQKASIPLLLLGISISLSRLYVGVHYPTDILGGLLVAAVAATSALLVMKRFWKKSEKKPEENS